MALRQNNEGAQLRYDFSLICETLYDLAERDDEFDFDGGIIISELDSARMKISYDDYALTAFWKPYLQDAKLDEALESHEELVQEIEHPEETMPRTDLGPMKTIGHAYDLSSHYSDFLCFCLFRGVLDNPIFDVTGTDPKFEVIR